MKHFRYFVNQTGNQEFYLENRYFNLLMDNDEMFICHPLHYLQSEVFEKIRLSDKTAEQPQLNSSND